MGNISRPRNPNAARRQPDNSNKAPKLKTPKKKRSNQDQSQEKGSKKNTNVSKRSTRSFLGFAIATASCLALWTWSIYQGTLQRQKDKKILASMLRKPLHITEHASCRMDCRFIQHSHITHALGHGHINNRKSNRTLRPCPKIVVDADVTNISDGNKGIQAVFSACPQETRVITVIDTRTDWPCGAC